jgi:hypothetical protein
MNLRFRSLTGVLVLVASAAVFPLAVTAQPRSSTQASGYETLPQVFNQAYFTNDPNFFKDQSVVRELDLIFGFRDSFLENEIRRDAELVDFVYKSSLNQQVSSGSIIRTPDLANPYNTSLLQSPALNPQSSSQTLPYP